MSFDVEYQGFGYGGIGVSTDISLFGDLTFEDMGRKACREVMPDMEDSTKTALRASVKHSGESNLVNSVKCFEPTMTKDGEGVKLVCQPCGRDSRSNHYTSKSHGKMRSHLVHNNDKAFWLEYGVAGRQAAHPWQSRAINSANAKVYPKIQQSIEKQLAAE